MKINDNTSIPRKMPHSETSGPLAKRQKRDLNAVQKSDAPKTSSNIFAPFRVRFNATYQIASDPSLYAA